MLQTELQSVITQSGSPADVYKLQWVLTASARWVIDSVVNPLAQYKSLHDLGRDANSQLDVFLNMTGRYRINLLMADFFEETDNVEQARILNMMNCNDVKRFRAPTTTGQDCRSWAKRGLCSTNATVASWCPLTCGLCHSIPGKPGDACSTDQDCLYANCHPTRKICLTDAPFQNSESCGASYQCWSGNCKNFNCVGSPIGSPCSYASECGSNLCLSGRCAGEPQYVTLGSWSPLCNSKPLDCENDPRGLVYVASLTCGADFDCIDGGVHVICANFVDSSGSTMGSHYYWVGEAPFCGDTKCRSSEDVVVMKSACGGDGGRCLEGSKALCKARSSP
jgi:hypothetical protein